LSFFEQPAPRPQPPTPSRRPPWLAPPENEFGSTVPVGLLLARSDELALALLSALAYSTGFLLRLALRFHPDAAIDPRGLMLQLHGGQGGSEEQLRFGVEFPDGRKATNLGARRPPAEEEPLISLAMAAGTGGGGLSFDFSYWVFPLPPPGTITLAVAWPSRGVAETRHVLEAAPILDAAGSSNQLWADARHIGGGGSGGTIRIA
jgi:hypothetical protein